MHFEASVNASLHVDTVHVLHVDIIHGLHVTCDTDIIHVHNATPQSADLS